MTKTRLLQRAAKGIRLRVYDKLAEMQIHKHNKAYRADMLRRWGQSITHNSFLARRR